MWKIHILFKNRTLRTIPENCFNKQNCHPICENTSNKIVNVDPSNSTWTSTSNKYTFKGLASGSRQIKITDNLTGSYQYLRTTVGLEQPANRRTRTYAFNGLDVLTGYTI